MCPLQRRFSYPLLFIQLFNSFILSSDDQVMVWIHGGALYLGGAAQFDGSVLTAYQDVVVVIIQYRLGILGYFR